MIPSDRGIVEFVFVYLLSGRAEVTFPTAEISADKKQFQSAAVATLSSRLCVPTHTTYSE